VAFPLLTGREILGLFDGWYDLSEVAKDVRQIISDDLGFTNFVRTVDYDPDSFFQLSINETGEVPQNIYLEELALANARSFGPEVTEKKHIENLDTLDKVAYNQLRTYIVTEDLKASIATGEAVGTTPRAYVKPTNFINEFLVPKVEELVDFITLEDLEKEVRNYSLMMKSKGYKFWTPYSEPPGAPFDLDQRINSPEKTRAIAIYGNQSGPYDVLSIGEGDSTVSSRFIARKFSSVASNYIKSVALLRRGPQEDLKSYSNYLFFAGGTGRDALENIFTDKRYGIVLDPSNPEIFTQSLFLQRSVGNKIELSRKYPAAPPLAGFVPFYTKSPPTVGTSGTIGAPIINFEEDVEKILSAIERIEEKIEVKSDPTTTVSLFKDVYKPRELAKIIMVRWALRILADQIRQLRTQIGISEDDEAVVALADEILETVKRERRANPDFDAYNEKTTEDLSKLVQRRLSISPQCFLISNIIEAARLNRKRLNIPQIADYKYCRLVSNTDNTSATINKLTKKKSQKNMLSMRTDHIAKLHPYLRIYNTIFNQEGKVEREAEFKFPNFTNVQSTNKKMDVIGYVSNKYTQDYGITSFNWNFVGSDPFSYANDIDATLTLHFNDFEQLVLLRQTKDYRTGENVKYRLLDLIALSEKELQELNKLGIGGSAVQKSEYKYDIRIDVGWTGAPANEVNGFDTEDSIRTLFLAMVDYDIGFNQEGFFELTINYKARLEQELYDRRTNVLELPTSEKKELESLQEELKAQQALSANGGTKNIDLVRQIENRISALQFDLKNRTFANITQYLLDRGSIFSEQISSAQLIGAELVDLKDNKSLNTTQSEEVFNNLKKLTDIPTVFANRDIGPDITVFSGPGALNYIYNLYDYFSTSETEFGDQLRKDIPNQEASFIPKKENGKYIVNFFFLGDLIEVLCKEIFEVRNFKDRSPEEKAYIEDIRVITTDFLIYDPNNLSSKKIYKVNIADIPISVDLFMSFYFEKVIKYSVSHYSLLKFIRDIISYCILNIFEECFGEDNLRCTINTAFADFHKEKTGSGPADPFRQLAQESNENQKVFLGDEDLGKLYDANATLYQSYLDLTKSTKIPNIASKNERADCVHALVIHTDAFDPDELKIEPGKYNEKRKIDNENGLYHLDIGSARGILKKINFSKTDQKYLREQRYTQDVAKGFAILSNVFDVDIDLVGNSMFFPGQRVYINLGERFSALGKPYAKGFSFSKVMGMGGYHLVTSVENEISSDGYSTKIKARWETSGDGLNKDVNSGVSVSAVGTGGISSTPLTINMTDPTPTE
jgi:hypothetical protein